MKFKRLPTGFIVPAQPVLASKPPSGAGWVHEIKHDGYRMIVRRDGAAVRRYSRNGNNWTARLSAIAIVFANACRLGAEGIVSKKIDGTYQSGPCRVWIKVRNPASIAVQRERSEMWNR
jgi:ATP-dependent DNA ligase